MLSLPGISDSLAAVLLPQQPTARSSNPALKDPWHKGVYFTVRLTAELPALRVHVRAGSGASKDPSPAFGAGTLGRWYAIGDVVLTSSEFLEHHALPAAFRYQDDWLLPSATVLNVGIAGALFRHSGGALQAEWLSGPAARARRVEGHWVNRWANA